MRVDNLQLLSYKNSMLFPLLYKILCFYHNLICCLTGELYARAFLRNGEPHPVEPVIDSSRLITFLLLPFFFSLSI